MERLAYVTNPGYGTLHELDILDLTAQKSITAFDTTPLFGPHGMAYVQDKVWFTAQGSKAIGRFDPQQRKVEWAMGTGQDTTHMIYVAPDAKTVCTTNVDSGTVSIFDSIVVQPTLPPSGVLPPGAKPRNDWSQTLVAVGKSAEGFDVSPDGTELWTASHDGKLYIVDIKKKTLSATIDTGVQGIHRMLFTPAGKSVIMVSVKTGDVLEYDAKTRKETRRITTGQGASMIMDAVGNRVFISCTPNNFVAVVDLKTLAVSKLDVGGRPDGLAWAVRK